MLIKEEYITLLRKGDKSSLEEVYKIYQPLYHFYFKHLLRNEKWVDLLVAPFYNELYEKINELKDNYNFEFWSLMLIKKSVRKFFKENERFSTLSEIDIEEILDAEFGYELIDDSLDRLQNLCTVLGIIYKLSDSEIGRLLNQSNTTIFLGKKTASKILFSKDGDSYKKDFKDKFLLKYDVLYSFDDVIKDIDFKERKSENDSAFSGGIKSIVLFIIIVVLVILLVNLIQSIGQDNENLSTTSALVGFINEVNL